ncbi:MAG: alpha/beta hydrolase family protein [Bacteroidales bacterium]
MKRYFLILFFLVYVTMVSGEKRPLDSKIYDGWRGVKSILVSENGDVVFTEYENFTDKKILEIKIVKAGIVKEIKGGEQPKFFKNQKFALYKVKETIFLINLSTGRTDLVGEAKSFDCKEDASFFTTKRGNSIYLFGINDKSGNARNQEPGFLFIDSLNNVAQSLFAGKNRVLFLTNRDSAGVKSREIVSFLSNDGLKINRESIYNTSNFIKELSANKNGEKILFYECEDSTGKRGVVCTYLRINEGGKATTELTVKWDLLPAGTIFNTKKEIAFSKNEDYLKFDIMPAAEKEEKDEKLMIKGKFEYELWRWNDTLLPSEKRDLEGAFARTFKCAYYLAENKLVRLSYGKGVFLMPDDNTPFGFELDNRPYMYTHLWEDPVAKDFYCINAKTGERWLFEKGFKGSFTVSNSTPHVFTFEPEPGAWYATDLEKRKKWIISDKIPYPLKDRLFDKPQEAGSYGQAGLSSDNRYFIVYDEFDVWALPISEGDGKPICVTNGFGREHNIKFKVLNTGYEKGKREGIDLNGEILLDAVNLNNMNSGYYRAKAGKNPVQLIETPHKYTFSKKIGDLFYLVKRESFNEAPDYWLTDRNFKEFRRLTGLNEQLNEYRTGSVKYINWRDKAGTVQTGLLYTPVDYDSTRTYPVIVYFYETMSQDAHYFYTPAPTTSTINPLMFVSRGYVVFMPDIRFEIGWPGRSSVNIVESGTRYLFEKGIADRDRIGVQGHSWGGYQVAYLITQTDLFRCACSETAVANMTSAYSGLRAGAGKPRMFMYESTQSRIGGNLWDKQQNYIQNSPLFFLDKVTTPLLSRHSDGDEAVPYSQGLELFIGLKRLDKEVWMFNYKGDGHNIKKREIAEDWTRRMDEYFDYYLLGAPKPDWM